MILSDVLKVLFETCDNIVIFLVNLVQCCYIYESNEANNFEYGKLKYEETYFIK